MILVQSVNGCNHRIGVINQNNAFPIVLKISDLDLYQEFADIAKRRKIDKRMAYDIVEMYQYCPVCGEKIVYEDIQSLIHIENKTRIRFGSHGAFLNFAKNQGFEIYSVTINTGLLVLNNVLTDLMFLSVKDESTFAYFPSTQTFLGDIKEVNIKYANQGSEMSKNIFNLSSKEFFVESCDGIMSCGGPVPYIEIITKYANYIVIPGYNSNVVLPIISLPSYLLDLVNNLYGFYRDFAWAYLIIPYSAKKYFKRGSYDLEEYLKAYCFNDCRETLESLNDIEESTEDNVVKAFSMSCEIGNEMVVNFEEIMDEIVVTEQSKWSMTEV